MTRRSIVSLDIESNSFLDDGFTKGCEMAFWAALAGYERVGFNYFVGSVIAEFGFIGESSGKNVNTTLDFLALSIGVFGLIGSIFFFFRKEYYLHCLPTHGLRNELL